MKRTILFSFIVLGITSLIAQVIIIRELMNNFYGNEFFIGLVLALWFLWVALGSLVLGRLFNKLKFENILKSLILCHLLVSLFLPLQIFLIRLIKGLGAFPGEIPDLLFSVISVSFVLAPLCLILGLQFTIGTRIFSNLLPKQKTAYPVGRGYLFETAGFIIGGIAFNFFLIRQNEFWVSSIIAGLNLIGIVLILAATKIFSLGTKIMAVLLIIFFLLLSFPSIVNYLNDYSNQLRFPNQDLIKSTNSFYGNIAITKTKDQYNFFETGLLLGSEEETLFNEYLVHFPLLFHPNPQKILLVGGGFNGAINEILKHQPEEVYYLELDPKLIEIAKKYLPPSIENPLSDPRVKIINTDGRLFLKTTLEKFDVVIVNLPNPSTALLNRFYTNECFEEIKARLNLQGIISTHLSYSPNYLNEELEILNASIYKTLKKVFPNSIILPEDTNFFIGSSEDMLNYDPQVLIDRFQKRKIQTGFIDENYIQYRLTNDRVSSALNSFENNIKAKINEDQFPISYYYNFLFWTTYFHPKLAKIFGSLLNLKFLWITLLFILAIALILIFRKKMVKRPKASLFLAMAVAGLFLMAAEVILIFAFQIFYGYLYYKIALIITILMAGMALGSWWGTTRILKKGRSIVSLVKIHGLIIGCCLVFLLIFSGSGETEFLLLVLAALAGFLTGLEFPYINKLYLAKQKNAQKKTGIIYGADLIGSCLGALLVGIFLIPVFGVFQTLFILIMANILIIITLFLSHKA